MSVVNTRGHIAKYQGLTYSIPSVDASFEGVFEEGQSFVFLENPLEPISASIRHGSQNDLGNLQARATKSVVTHACCLGLDEKVFDITMLRRGHDEKRKAMC
jgi:hypothetical protein